MPNCFSAIRQGYKYSIKPTGISLKRLKAKDYYYRKRRDGDRVISEYMGHDLAGQLFTEQDRQERVKLLVLQRMQREEKSEFEETDQDCELLLELARRLVQATFLTSGYHPHKGQWRKVRYDN